MRDGKLLKLISTQTSQVSKTLITFSRQNKGPFNETTTKNRNKRRKKYFSVTHLAHSNINFPIFSKLTICAAAASQRRPKSDSKNSFDNSSSRIIADESNLFKSATPPA